MSRKINFVDVFEQKPSDIKLSSFLKDKETFLEFALRLYVNFGRDVYYEFTDLVENSQTVSEFAEKFFNQYMVVYSDVPSLFDYTVANSVKQINSLSEDSRKRLWNEMSSMNKLDIWEKASLNRYYAVGFSLNMEEINRWGKINDKLQPKVLIADKCLQSIKEYIGSFPEYSNIQNIPIVVAYNVLKYLHTKWSLDEESFHYDPNNISYISYIQTLCNNVFSNANIDSDKPYIFFVNALAVGNKDVMANVYQNFVIGKTESKRSVNINIVENVMKGPREVTIDDLDSFVSLLNQTWGITDKQAEQRGTFYTRWFNYEMGKKYCRITTGPYNSGMGTAYCFIDLANGNIYKPNGYKAPDKKHVRRNIFGENPLSGLNEYGTNYLR